MPKVTFYTYHCSDCGNVVNTIDGVFGCSGCQKKLCFQCTVEGVLCKSCYESLSTTLQSEFQKKINRRIFADGVVKKILVIGFIAFLPLMFLISGADGNALDFVLPYVIVLFGSSFVLKIITQPYESISRSIMKKHTGKNIPKLKV